MVLGWERNMPWSWKEWKLWTHADINMSCCCACALSRQMFWSCNLKLHEIGIARMGMFHLNFMMCDVILRRQKPCWRGEQGRGRRWLKKDGKSMVPESIDCSAVQMQSHDRNSNLKANWAQGLEQWLSGKECGAVKSVELCQHSGLQKGSRWWRKMWERTMGNQQEWVTWRMSSERKQCFCAVFPYCRCRTDETGQTEMCTSNSHLQLEPWHKKLCCLFVQHAHRHGKCASQSRLKMFSFEQFELPLG